jgi:pimeloyl-ACP methyl ester carboxylesterase
MGSAVLLKVQTVILFFSILIITGNLNLLSAQDQDTSSGYSEEDCYVSGVRSVLRCYSLVRPLYEGSDEMTVIRGVIVPSRAAAPEKDPFVILAGGPGQAASDLIAALGKSLRGMRANRAVIFFDIRGTGMSEAVVCDDVSDDVFPLTYVSIDKIISTIGECYKANGAKLMGFSTQMAVADLEALRQALGVEQFNLWGGSYGTRFAQYYIHNHPEQVRSAVLDAVVPFSPSYITLQAGNALAVLEKLRLDCAADYVCASVYAGFDPINLLNQIKPEQEISYTHPVTGERVDTTTNRDVVAQVIFSALYSPTGRSFVPYALTQAINKNNWAPLSVLAVDIGEYLGIQTIYMPTFLSITCAEERSSINAAENNTDPFFNGTTIKMMKRMCDVWSVATKSLPQVKDNSVSVPTVMISGGYDPITPPIMAEHALKAFNNARHIIIEDGGHLNSTIRCVGRFLTKFVGDPADLEIEPNCVDGGDKQTFIVGPNASVQLGGGS